MDKELLELRKKIDKIDDEVFSLLEKRYKVVKEVGDYKKKKNLPVIASDREKEIIEKRIEKSSLGSDFIKKYYRLIINNAYTIENICLKK